MAFQQGGMNGGPGAPGDLHAPQGTEYTLQGQTTLCEMRGPDGGLWTAEVRPVRKHLLTSPCRGHALPPNRMA